MNETNGDGRSSPKSDESDSDKFKANASMNPEKEVSFPERFLPIGEGGSKKNVYYYYYYVYRTKMMIMIIGLLTFPKKLLKPVSKI